MKVFIVTSYLADEKDIEAVFYMKELAEQFIAAFKPNGYVSMDIEEWELNPFKLELKWGYKPYWVRMDKEGKVDKIEWQDNAYGLRCNGDPRITFAYKNEYINLHCFAKDEEHAIRLADEQRLLHIANNVWGGKLQGEKIDHN